MGKYQGRTEEIDSCDTPEDANIMLAEYEMAFGRGWTLWIKMDCQACDGTGKVTPVDCYGDTFKAEPCKSCQVDG